MTANIGLFNK